MIIKKRHNNKIIIYYVYNTACVLKCCYQWCVCGFCLWSHPVMTWSGFGVWTRVLLVPSPWQCNWPAGRTWLETCVVGQVDPWVEPNRFARLPFCPWAGCRCAGLDLTSWLSYAWWSDTGDHERQASSTPTNYAQL